jgi:hypothetical protein
VWGLKSDFLFAVVICFAKVRPILETQPQSIIGERDQAPLISNAHNALNAFAEAQRPQKVPSGVSSGVPNIGNRRNRRKIALALEQPTRL